MIFLLACKIVKPTVVQKMVKIFFFFNFNLEEQNLIILIKVHGILSRRIIQVFEIIF